MGKTDHLINSFGISQNEGDDFFELLPGKIVDVQIDYPVTVRLKLPLVGYELGRYIILKYPDVARVHDYSDVLVEGNVVIVRYILEGAKGQCFAFQTAIRNISQYPEKFLILSYPKKIQNRQLRQQQRHTIHVPAVLMLDNGAERVKGIINDISNQGCGFIFKSGNTQTKVKKLDIFVCVQSSMNEEIKIPAKVCNSRNEHGKVSVGIQFLSGDKQVSHLLDHLLIDAEFN
jgi:hypothetical protein